MSGSVPSAMRSTFGRARLLRRRSRRRLGGRRGRLRGRSRRRRLAARGDHEHPDERPKRAGAANSPRFDHESCSPVVGVGRRTAYRTQSPTGQQMDARDPRSRLRAVARHAASPASVSHRALRPSTRPNRVPLEKPWVSRGLLTVKDRLPCALPRAALSRGHCDERGTGPAARASAQDREERCARPLALVRPPARVLDRCLASRTGPERARDRDGRVRQGRRLRSEPGLDGPRLRAQPPPEARALLRDRRPSRAAASRARARGISRLVVASRLRGERRPGYATDRAAPCTGNPDRHGLPGAPGDAPGPSLGRSPSRRVEERLSRPPRRRCARVARPGRSRRILRGRGAAARAVGRASRRRVADLGGHPRPTTCRSSW